ncbi:MAG: hypothetical protein AB7G15_10670 [Alphaproteobacteria bacterium]
MAAPTWPAADGIDALLVAGALEGRLTDDGHAELERRLAASPDLLDALIAARAGLPEETAPQAVTAFARNCVADPITEPPTPMANAGAARPPRWLPWFGWSAASAVSIALLVVGGLWIAGSIGPSGETHDVAMNGTDPLNEMIEALDEGTQTDPMNVLFFSADLD